MAYRLAHDSHQLDLFRDRLPHKPYCTDDLERGIRPRTARLAAQHAYIQPNPPMLRAWLVFDVDRSGAAMAWEDALLPPPTWSATNPRNAHAHIAYGLEVPVGVGLNHRIAPARYAAAVEAGFTLALDADSSYSGLICKNPLRGDIWRVLKGGQMYDLDELSEYIDLGEARRELGRNRRRKHPENYGLQRNITLFEDVRRWAYGQVDDYRKQGEAAFDAFSRAVLAEARRANAANVARFAGLDGSNYAEGPLYENEARHLARSVSRWTWTRYWGAAESRRRFSAKQAARGRLGGAKSGEVRAAKAAKQAQLALDLRREGHTNAQVASRLGIHEKHVPRLVRGQGVTRSQNQITALSGEKG